MVSLWFNKDCINIKHTCLIIKNKKNHKGVTSRDNEVQIHLQALLHKTWASTGMGRYRQTGKQAEVGSNELHLLRYIYLSTFFG